MDENNRIQHEEETRKTDRKLREAIPEALTADPNFIARLSSLRTNSGLDFRFGRKSS